MIISKKSWHYRLQQYVLGTVPKYNGLCPYFWMTLACMLFLLPVTLKKEVYDRLKELNERFQERMHQKYILGLSSEEDLYKHYKRVARWKFDDDFWILIREGRFQESDLYKFLEQFANRRWEETKKNAKAEARFLEIVDKTSNIIKKIGKFLGYVFIVAVSLTAVGVIVAMFYEIHTKGAWMNFLIALGIIAGVIVTLGIVYIVYDNIKYSEGYRSSKKKLFKLIAAPFKFTYEKSKAVVDFVFENYCPRIEIRD